MWDYVRKRRKEILVAAAATVATAGVAGASYLWWSSLQLERVRRKASQVELKELLKVTDPGWSSEGLTSGDPAAVQQALAQVAARASTGQLLGMSDAAPRQFEARSCSSPGEHSSRHTQNGTVQGSDGHGPQGLDSSMDSHFGYIQEVSTAEELEQLMGQLKATLYEATDVTRQLSMLPAGATAADKLHLLALVSFSRAVGTAWLLPFADLYVRCKLNIIGRHLFLQEKLAELRVPPAAPVAAPNGLTGLLPGAAGLMGPQPSLQAEGGLPPKLAAAAVEAFLSCPFLLSQGSQWIVHKVMAAVDAGLRQLQLGGKMGPQELIQALGNMLVSVEGVLGGDWATLLVGSDVFDQPMSLQQVGPAGLAAHRQGQAAAAMVEELHSELRAALSSTRFTEAVRAGVQHTFRQLAEHVYLAAFAPKPAGAASQAGALTSQGGGLSAELSGQNAGSTGASEISAADSQSSSPEPTKSTQTSTSAAAEPQESFTVRLSTSLLSLMGLSGSAPAAGPPSPSKPAPALIQHDPVPVARLLKPVQSAADPLFADVRQVTKGIAHLPAVTALSASVFASPIMSSSMAGARSDMLHGL